MTGHRHKICIFAFSRIDNRLHHRTMVDKRPDLDTLLGKLFLKRIKVRRCILFQIIVFFHKLRHTDYLIVRQHQHRFYGNKENHFAFEISRKVLHMEQYGFSPFRAVQRNQYRLIHISLRICRIKNSIFLPYYHAVNEQLTMADLSDSVHRPLYSRKKPGPNRFFRDWTLQRDRHFLLKRSQ